jgi:YfiH family protein
MLTSPNLDLPKIRHGFFTREGGASEGIYASLNCGPGSGDDMAKVVKNRASVAHALGQAPESLVTAYQIHSPNVVIVDKPWTEAPQADAMATNVPGITLGILTADCLPILFADSKHRVIGAAHAGWKGAYDGVIEAAIGAMLKLGAKLPDISAAIGPAIAQRSYEVGGEFLARFLMQSNENQIYFANSPREGHYQFDLKNYARKRLKNAGVTNINILAHDTASEENRFFSYRRGCIRGEKSYGRQISAIVLDKA